MKKTKTLFETPALTEEETEEATKLTVLPLVQTWDYCLTRKDIPPLVPIVDNLLLSGTKLMICAGAKMGKTWITMQLALAIAAGKEFLGWKCQKKKVLYVNLELDDHNFSRRVRIFADHIDYAPDQQMFFHLPMRGNMRVGIDLNMAAIIEVVETLGIDVVFLDPVYKLNHEGDENSARDMTQLCNAIDRLSTKTKCAVVINDHTGKGGQADKDPMDVIRGSSAKAGDMDSMMILRKLKDSDAVRADVIHRHLPPVKAFAAKFEFPLLVPDPDSDPEAMHNPSDKAEAAASPKAPSSDVVRDVLRGMADSTADNPMNNGEIAAACGMPKRRVEDLLPLLRSRRLITSVGSGKSLRKHITPGGLRLIE